MLHNIIEAYLDFHIIITIFLTIFSGILGGLIEMFVFYKTTNFNRLHIIDKIMYPFYMLGKSLSGCIHYAVLGAIAGFLWPLLLLTHLMF